MKECSKGQKGLQEENTPKWTKTKGNIWCNFLEHWKMIVFQLVLIVQLFRSQKRLKNGVNTFSKMVSHFYRKKIKIFDISCLTILLKFHQNVVQILATFLDNLDNFLLKNAFVFFFLVLKSNFKMMVIWNKKGYFGPTICFFVPEKRKNKFLQHMPH